MNVTDFIIRSACESAEQARSDQTRFVLHDKQWKAFMTALDPSPKASRGSAVCSPNHMQPSAGHEWGFQARIRKIEKLRRERDLTRFDCGKARLNTWSRKYAWMNQQADQAKTSPRRPGILPPATTP